MGHARTVVVRRARAGDSSCGCRVAGVLAAVIGFLAVPGAVCYSACGMCWIALWWLTSLQPDALVRLVAGRLPMGEWPPLICTSIHVSVVSG